MYKEVFQARIKAIRIEKCLSQKEVEEYTNIKQSNISKYENGNLEPDIEQLGILAEYYKVSTDWLLGIGQKEVKQNDNNRSNK